MPIPDVGDGQDADDVDADTDPLEPLRRDLAAAGGKTVLAPTTAAGYGAGPAAAPPGDYRSVRFGMNPPESVVEARRDVERSVLATYGIPPILQSNTAAGAGVREGVEAALLVDAGTARGVGRLAALRVPGHHGHARHETLPGGRCCLVEPRVQVPSERRHVDCRREGNR